MKKIVLPALLCMAYSALLAGYFSTDFSKEGGFIKAEPKQGGLRQLPAASALIGRKPVRGVVKTVAYTGADAGQGESAMK